MTQDMILASLLPYRVEKFRWISQLMDGSWYRSAFWDTWEGVETSPVRYVGVQNGANGERLVESGLFGAQEFNVVNVFSPLDLYELELSLSGPTNFAGY